MAHTKAALKGIRQTKKRTARNRQVKERIKDALKALGKLVAAKKIDEAKAMLPKLYKMLDKAAKMQIMPKNKAERLKSRWAKQLVKQ
ncbi:MAG: 30S ribosomal protein S20 [Parcubacteria group bacterium GW2011_GWA2_47_26]|nr:MAG: 30S ribosomal protein S20 [Parcubacteria group bacterium GW2011_GWA2_47_26]